MRKAVLAVFIALAASIAPGQVAGAATTISFSVSNLTGTTLTTLNVGTTAYVRGKVSPTGATPTVVLQREVSGRWSDRGSATVGADGTFGIVIKPSQEGLYVLRVRSAGGSVVSAKQYLAVTNSVRIVARISYPLATPGTKLHVTGSVNPPAATPRVVVQRRVSGRWSDRQSGAVSAGGTFDIVVTVSQLGSYELRVRSNGGSVTSNIVRVSVLTSVPPRP